MALFATALAAWPLLESRATNSVAELARNRTRDEFIAVAGEYLSKQSARDVALPTAICPYVVKVVHSDKGEMNLATGTYAKTYKYYVWLFGLRLRLPVETEIDTTG